MQDLSRVTGDPIVIRDFRGKDYTVKGFTFDDIGLLQGEMLRRKRKQVVDTAMEFRSLLPADEAKEHIQQAIRDASQIQYISDEEVNAFVMTTEGIKLFVWILLNRQYPGEFSESTMLELFASNKLGQEQIEHLLNTLNPKNEIGPTP